MLYDLWNRAHRRLIERKAHEAHIEAWYARLAGLTNEG